MKYESTILKRLIDTYGVVGNPRYISEIIKEFIVRGKECFPNLFTYQADWLAHIDEFGLNPTYTVSYTGQSIYAPNTLERPVKSAILKGSTKYRDIDTGEILESFEDGRNLELVSVKMPVLTTTGKNLIPQDYQQGDWNQWSAIIEESSKCITSKDYIDVSTIKDTVTTTISDGYKYSFCFYGKNKEHIYIDDYWGNGFTGEKTFNFKTVAGHKGEVYYIRINISKVDKTDIKPNEIHNIGFQIEKGTTATTYEPYKSNILTVNEDVELGSVGEVKDELNLLTGQLTQRTETRPYQEGDELNSEFVTDMTNTRYKLAQEVVKTVDLTILDQNGQNVKQLMSFNGGTHFNTRSSEGSLLPLVSVSVETDLEETLMVCSLEGNTM